MFILIDFSRVGMVTFHDTLNNVRNMIEVALETNSQIHVEENFWVYNLDDLEEVIFVIDELNNVSFEDEDE